MGQKKGKTGNPYGRPIGSKNRASLIIKDKIEAILVEKSDAIFNSLDKIEKPEMRLKLFIELAKLIMPRPQQSMEDIEREERAQSTLRARLFNDIN